MGHGDAHERNRSRQSRHAGGQQAGQQNQDNPEGLDPNAHALGVALPQSIGGNGFAQSQRPQNPRQAQCRRQAHILPAGPGEGAHRPVRQVHHIVVVGKGDTEVRHRAADIAHHDADDQQHGHGVHLLGKQQNHGGNEQRPGKGRQNQRHRTDAA